MQSHWRDILLSWKTGRDLTFAKSEWLRRNAVYKVKRMTTSKETRWCVGVPGYLGPMRAWTLVIEMIAKPALPIWFSKIAWQATCNINRTQFRTTPDWRWSDCSLQSRIKNNQSKRKYAMRKQRIRRCEADAMHQYPVSLAINLFIKWSIKCQ